MAGGRQRRIGTAGLAPFRAVCEALGCVTGPAPSPNPLPQGEGAFRRGEPARGDA